MSPPKVSVASVEADKSNLEDHAFGCLGISQGILWAMERKGYKAPTQIQKEAIPHLLEGRDLIGQAQTGSGKTAAFAIPALDGLQFDKRVEVLVLVPTRELCRQVVDEFRSLDHFGKAGVVSVVGGEPPFRQIELINRGAQIVVATPGRLLDHLGAKKLKAFAPSMIVLDEADEMLDMGFLEDVEKILEYLPKERQTVLFSATMPKPIMNLASRYLTDPVHVKLVDTATRHDDIDQLVYVIRHQERDLALFRILESEPSKRALVFCRTRRDTDAVCSKLIESGLQARCLSGDLSQNERNRAIQGFQSGAIQVLVATDVASRGLDIDDLSLVINFNPPENLERYTHRIGRTGRAGKKGRAVSLVCQRDLQEARFLLNKIEKGEAKLAELPTRRDLDLMKQEQFVNAVLNTAVSESAEDICAAVSVNDIEEDFLLRLCSYAFQSMAAKGPESVGLTAADAEKLLKRGSSPTERRSRRQRRQGGWQGGRGSGRPGDGKGPREGGRTGGRPGGRTFGKSNGGWQGKKPRSGSSPRRES